MFEVITPGGSPTTATPGPAPSGTAQSDAAKSGTVSIEDALKGAEHAKMNTFSVSDMSKGSAGPNGAPGSTGAPLPGSTVSLGGMVQGKLVVDLMDALLPAIIVLAFHRFGLSIKKSQMQLTQGEKNTLGPIVDACLQSINLDFSNPWSALSVTLLVIYGGKALEVGGTGWLDKKTSETKPFEQPAAKTPLSPMSVVGGSMAKGSAPVIDKPNNDTTSFHPDGPATWTEADVKAVVKKRKCSYAKAVEWLGKNWQKNGGVL